MLDRFFERLLVKMAYCNCEEFSIITTFALMNVPEKKAVTLCLSELLLHHAPCVEKIDCGSDLIKSQGQAWIDRLLMSFKVTCFGIVQTIISHLKFVGFWG